MPKVYSFCIVVVILTATSAMPTEPFTGFWFYVGCALAAVVCYFVTVFQDAKDPHRPNWKLRLSSTIAAAYLAFFLYPSVKDFELNLILIKFKPFPTIHIFIGMCSFFSISIFRELKTLGNFGFRKYLGKLGDMLKAASKEKKE